jgi:hypothetical protein
VIRRAKAAVMEYIQFSFLFGSTDYVFVDFNDISRRSEREGFAVSGGGSAGSFNPPAGYEHDCYFGILAIGPCDLAMPCHTVGGLCSVNYVPGRK